MTTPQIIYLCLLALYALLFLSFTRLFAWKRFADRNYWHKRPSLSLPMLQELADKAARDLPRLSVFVPARSEADVIEKTIDHMSRLDYPKEYYEVLVATDEKEVLAAQAEREKLVGQVMACLHGQETWPTLADDKATTLLVGLLARLSQDEVALAEREAGQYLSMRDVLALPADRQREIIRETALALQQAGGRLARNRTLSVIARVLGNVPDTPADAMAEAERLYPVCLGLAVPVVLAAANICNGGDHRLVARIITRAARARQPLTQKVLVTLTDTISHRILSRLLALRRSGDLVGVLEQCCTDCFPTTQEIVERKREEYALRSGVPALKHVLVPFDFDGNLHGLCTGESVPSTKGRALNYAYTFADTRSEMFGYYDAESRPHGKVLQYAAWKLLTQPERVHILQGPVFQVRNFFKMGPISKVVALYQSISHDWGLPVLMQTLPFVGGTNLFIDPHLLEQIAGYDHHCLTEDLELGIRAWMQENAWPDYLPFPSSEQTPPTFRAFFRQRLRWGSGYLQVYDKVREEASFPEEKRRSMLKALLMKGQMQWILYQVVALLPLVVWILYSQGLVDPSVVPFQWRVALNSVVLIYIAFTAYTVARYYKHVEAPPQLLLRIGGFAQLLALPISAFFLTVPYSSALVLKSLGRAPKAWVKTPRSKE